MASTAKKAAKKPAAKTTPKKPVPAKKAASPVAPANAVAGATPVTETEKTKARVETIDGVKVHYGITLPQRAVATVSDLDKVKVGGALFFDATIDKTVYKSAEEGAKAQREAAAVKANRANGQVRRYTKRNPDTKFIVRTLPNARAQGFDGDVGVVIQRTK